MLDPGKRGEMWRGEVMIKLKRDRFFDYTVWPDWRRLQINLVVQTQTVANTDSIGKEEMYWMVR